MLSAIVATAPLGIWTIDLNGSVTFWNKGAERLFGWAEQEVLGQPLPVIPPDQRDEFHLWLEQFRHGLNHAGAERQRQHRDGSLIWTNIWTAPLLNNQSAVNGVIGIVADVSNRKRAEQALRDSADKFRLLFANNPQPMWVFDAQTLRFLEVNDAAINHYGYSREEFLATTVSRIRPQEDVSRLAEYLSTKGDEEFRNAGEWRHLLRDGRIIDAEVSAHRIEFAGRTAVLTVALDITERKRLEEQLRQSQKMEAVGRLAGGIAHDFNNLLTVIVGYSDVLLDKMRVSDPDRAAMEEIQKAGTRASELTRQLLAFSRRQSLDAKIVSLNSIVSGMEGMIRRLIPENIEVTSELSSEAYPIRADKGQIEQVLLNLCLNARDAMPDGGNLRIETQNVELSPEFAHKHLQIEPGPHVMLGVADTGIGMSADTQNHLFEPFFTTKDSGHGTGLGLSIVYGIVRQHGGTIWVYSEEGRGTSIKVYLPVSAGEDAALPKSAAPLAQLRGSETILVVEDQAEVRRFMAGALMRAGYNVLEAASGEHAKQILNDHTSPIHLLVTDMVMPGSNGREVARAARSARPDIGVIFTSGYTGNVIEFDNLTGTAAIFLQKPFGSRTLEKRVRDVLDRRDVNPEC
jgi:two-component system cell cycle sensor histidine kinase/response regulator CckA